MQCHQCISSTSPQFTSYDRHVYKKSYSVIAQVISILCAMYANWGRGNVNIQMLLYVYNTRRISDPTALLSNLQSDIADIFIFSIEFIANLISNLCISNFLVKTKLTWTIVLKITIGVVHGSLVNNIGIRLMMTICIFLVTFCIMML